MRRKLVVTILFCGLYLLCHNLSAQSTYPEDILPLISEAVFEIVVLKPTEDTLKYEKELPLDLIPYAIRVDKYYSIGTAFAISENRFVSVAHMFNISRRSHFKMIYIRDKKGDVFPVTTIYQYSDNRDFIVFGAQGKTVQNYFKTSKEFSLNQKVFAVGNAFGQGIIVRDGVLTSETPEVENGKWKWLRFSAAVSPGNSGGPLLNKNGLVIGVITMKSKNENLNYALPYYEIDAFEKNKAVSYKKIIYYLDITTKNLMDTFEYSVDLPKEYEELKQVMTKEFAAFSSNMLEKLLVENKDDIFPNGPASLELLYSRYTAVFPYLIMEGEDEKWSVYSPEDMKKAQLDNNGYIEYGNINNYTFLYFQKPDDISIKKIVSDPKLYLDIVAKGISFFRDVGNEKVRITSLGDPETRYIHNDNYGRKWLVAIWPWEYNDMELIVFSLPVPGGMVAFLQLNYTDTVRNGLEQDMKALTDFFYLSYYGTFREWKEFLSQKDYIPDVLKTASFSYIPGKNAEFSTQKVKLLYDNSILTISDDTDLRVEMSYFKDKEQIIWDIQKVIVGENKNTDSFFSYSRVLKPVQGLPDIFGSEWNKICAKKFPYTGKAIPYEGNTYMYVLHSKYKNLIKNVKPEDVSCEYFYLLCIGLEDKVKNRILRKKIRALDRMIQILEE